MSHSVAPDIRGPLTRETADRGRSPISRRRGAARSATAPVSGTLNAMTIDVEDYFQVSAFESHVPRHRWDKIERRVERNTDHILEILDNANIRATFFTLGWIAKRHPALIRRIVAGGHELASHGWDHVRVTTMSREDFEADVRRAKGCLEDIAGQRIRGYRAPTYSFDHRTPWAHDVLADTGHLYSSSIAPVKHDLYGVPGASRFAFRSAGGRLLEVPISTAMVGGRNRMCAGGGWFRLYPYPVTRHLIAQLNRQEGQSAVFYCHPWEFDAAQPRLSGLGPRTRFRHYLNLERVPARVAQLLRDFRWDRMDRVFSEELGRLDADVPHETDPVLY